MISQYTSAPFTYPGGGIAAGVPVAVYFGDTTVLAELYHEALGAVRKANPTRTNDAGIVTFFALPGEYDLVANGVTTTITVPGIVDPPTGDDFITQNQADVRYLQIPTAAATYLPKTGGTLTGDLAITDGVAKAYRLRRSGSALDLDAAGAKMYLSVFENGDFTGAQRTYLVLESGASIAQAVGQWQWRETPDGAERHRIDAGTGVASLGSKNGLTNVKLCGLKSTPGSPTTGTWELGDAVVDSVGALFICTTAGTPGVWAGSNDTTTVFNTNTSNYQYFMLPGLGVTTTITPAANTCNFTPLVLQKSGNLTDVQIEVTTLDGGANLRVGIASSNADGLPGTWLADLGNTASVGGTGVKSLAAAPNLPLAAGVRYWIGLAAQGNTVLQLRGRSGANPHVSPVLLGTTPGGGSGLYNNSRTHYRATVVGALSGGITVDDVTSSGPMCGVKVV